MNDNRSDAEKAAIRAEVERVRLEHHDLEAAMGRVKLKVVPAPRRLSTATWPC